ncbi:MAG: mandelate racemase/muconate lactonizing enzyme family protein [Proteobacteria bacterium]|nr:mandelate racemase/muconate lactonizing enzyme family protein [Burkholderiales bacterium]
MPKIQSVSVANVRVPLDNATAFSTRLVTGRDYGLVKVRADDGIEGIGFCYTGSQGGALTVDAVRLLLAPLLIGRESTSTEALWSAMYAESLLQGRSGSVMRALSILDTALWDLNARAAKLPLWRYLGAAFEDSVPAYASGGYYLDGKGPKQLGKEVADYVKLGFQAVKIKVGKETPKGEAARVRAAREAIGPDVLLMLDANNAWSDVPTALEYCKRFEAYDPYWIEEPFGPDELDNHAKLAQRTPITVATGEIGYGRWYFKELLDKQAAEILQTDACVCGGITEWRRIAATAASYGVTMCPHWFHDLHVHLVAATPNARFVEFFTDDQVLNFRNLIDTQLEFRKGRLMLPQTPGLGFGFDEKRVRKFASEPSTAKSPWIEIR